MQHAQKSRVYILPESMTRRAIQPYLLLVTPVRANARMFFILEKVIWKKLFKIKNYLHIEMNHRMFVKN